VNWSLSFILWKCKFLLCLLHPFASICPCGSCALLDWLVKSGIFVWSHRHTAAGIFAYQSSIILPIFCCNYAILEVSPAVVSRVHVMWDVALCHWGQCFLMFQKNECLWNVRKHKSATHCHFLLFFGVHGVELGYFGDLFAVNVWYPGAVLIINHFCLCGATLAFMKNWKFKCSVAVCLSSHHCMGVPWC
jgi:hypothetical protein